MDLEPKILQQEIWHLIDNLYQSGFTTPHIEIQSAFTHGNDGKNYNVKYSGRDGFSLNFTTSDSYGIWGIDKMIKVEQIISLIKETGTKLYYIDGQPMLERTFKANFDDLQQRREDKLNQILND